GVASPTDPIWMNQYREDEIRAIVNECVERRTYAAAHCHPASSVRRCVEFGVRSIEHGTLIDDETARYVASTDAYIVPTMVIIFALVELLRQATSVNAELMLMKGEIGCVAPGARADLLLVDGDPLKDIGLLAADG